MSNRVERNPARTRIRILEETVRLIAIRGTATSLSDIALAAGVSKGAITRHYSTRDELLLEALKHALAQFRLAVEERLEGRVRRKGDVVRAYVETLCTGPLSIIHFHGSSALWHAVIDIPGVGEVIRADFDSWSRELANDGLDPDRVLVITLAAESMAVSRIMDEDVDEAMRIQEILLALTLSTGPLSSPPGGV